MGPFLHISVGCSSPTAHHVNHCFSNISAWPGMDWRVTGEEKFETELVAIIQHGVANYARVDPSNFYQEVWLEYVS